MAATMTRPITVTSGREALRSACLKMMVRDGSPEARRLRMKSRAITSDIESRVCLATLVIECSATAKTGRISPPSHIDGESAKGV